MWRSASLLLALASCAAPAVPDRSMGIDPAASRIFEGWFGDDRANLRNAATPGYRAMDPRIGLRERIHAQGRMIRTGRDLDLAVQGDGFFRVRCPDGTLAYTRAGDFRLDGQRRLTLSGAGTLDPEVRVPARAGRFWIDRSGQVWVHDPESPEGLKTIARVELARFVTPKALQSEDGVFFRESDECGGRIDGHAGTDPVFGILVQGTLEISNMSRLSAELSLQRHQREYSRFLSTSGGR